MLIFAHRGASAFAPENTMAAFLLAIEKGSKAIEFDVQLTKDEQVVIFHDFTLKRIVGEKGYIKDYTLEELKKFDIGVWYGEDFANERIITLEDILITIPKGIILNVEIKNLIEHQELVSKKVVELINKYERKDDVIISAFDHEVLRHVYKLDKDIKVGLLIYANILEPWNYAALNNIGIYSIHPTEEYVDKKFIEKAHGKGLKVLSYTVNSSERAKELMEMGIDGIFSDNPKII